MPKLFNLISQVNIDSECEKIQIKEKTDSILKKYLNNKCCNFKHCISFLKKYQTHANNNGGNIFEIHILLGKNNEYIDCSINRKQGGELTEKMLKYIDKYNSHLIHNHPSNGSLSTSDWNVLVNHLTLQMTAVNDFGSYFTGSVTQKMNHSTQRDFTSTLQTLQEIIKESTLESGVFACSNLKNGIYCDINAYINNMNIWLNHKLGLVLSNAKISNYTYKLSISDNVNKDITNNLDKTHFQKTLCLIQNW
ncbi:hypothetical protein [Morganella psychrotolerans]|uniref:hypothetical protein n=1 Tax=Morganella psychrotolerans TaxID=368603 RepID=UPI0039AE9D4E